MSYMEFVETFFSDVARYPMAERHHRLWQWIEDLRTGTRPLPKVEIWPRGGAKSSTGELGVARVGAKLSRRFVLYVCETQDQADRHIQSIATLFETLGIERAIGKYGASKGWRRDQLRTATGFNVAAFGLDAAARGIKLDQFRPDFIIFDDVDGRFDTPKTTEKKKEAIKSSILPAGSDDCAYLFLQNLIHDGSIAYQLHSGTAGFLRDREKSPLEVAVRDLEVELYDRGDGAMLYRIVKGEATWAGQNLATAERQINDWDLSTFLREAQHEVDGADGYFFDVSQIEIVDEVPKDLVLRRCRAWDLAATQDGGDATAGPRLGMAPNGVLYWEDLQYGRFASHKVRKLVRDTAIQDRDEVGHVVLRLPQDPGQAGKDQAEQYKDFLSEFDPKIEPVSGSKSVRARFLADKVNSGNVKMIRGAWNEKALLQLKKFREDGEHDEDDIVDGAADAANELAVATSSGTLYQAPPEAQIAAANPMFDMTRYRPQ